MQYSNIIKTEEDYKTLKKACDISVSILKELSSSVKEGISAGDINELAIELCAKNKVKAAFLGVSGPQQPFEYSVCISVNDTVLHGVPHSSIVFKSGDLVKVDFGIIYNGFFTDHCVTVSVGEITKEEKRLMATGRLCIETAVKEAVVGKSIYNISYALESVCKLAGFDFVKNYCGHGIGKSLWLPPEVLSYATNESKSIQLLEGMCLCIENQLTMGSSNLYLDSDGWSLKTKDGSKGVMFEHMVIVRKNKPEILTLID